MIKVLNDLELIKFWIVEVQNDNQSQEIQFSKFH